MITALLLAASLAFPPEKNVRCDFDKMNAGVRLTLLREVHACMRSPRCSKATYKPSPRVRVELKKVCHLLQDA